MEIKILEKGLFKKYNDFLHACPGSLFYYSLKYKGFLEQLLDCESSYLLAVDHDTIHGVFPLMRKKGNLGIVYNSLPFYGSNGGIISRSPGVFRLLKEEYNRLILKEPVAAATMIENPLLNNDYSGLSHDMTEKRIGQWTPLPVSSDPEEELMNRFESSARRNIRRALKSGVKAGIDSFMMDFLMEVHTRNMAAIGGKAKSADFFGFIDRHFEAGKDYNIYVARLGDTPVSALLLFYFNLTVEYFIPVTLDRYRSLQPLALLIYQAMIDASQRGFQWWNWGGTWLTQEGVYRFKKKWGAIDKEYTYYIKVNNEEIYKKTKEELLRSYDNFYVIDFRRLKRGVKN